MANIKSAKKRITVIEKKTARNRRVKGHLKDVLKSFEANLEAGDMEAAKADLKLAEKKLMQAAAKGTIHKNAASRKVSRFGGKPEVLDALYRDGYNDMEANKEKIFELINK